MRTRSEATKLGLAGDDRRAVAGRDGPSKVTERLRSCPSGNGYWPAGVHEYVALCRRLRAPSSSLLASLTWPVLQARWPQARALALGVQTQLLDAQARPNAGRPPRISPSLLVPGRRRLSWIRTWKGNRPRLPRPLSQERLPPPSFFQSTAAPAPGLRAPSPRWGREGRPCPRRFDRFGELAVHGREFPPKLPG